MLAGMSEQELRALPQDEKDELLERISIRYSFNKVMGRAINEPLLKQVEAILLEESK